MPRSGQIIPRYLHPHDEVYINDNTVYTDYTSDNDGIVRYLCVFPASKGRDKLMNFRNFSAWVEEYGRPNFRVHGQATYMPYTMLGTGLTEVQCLRVVAEDSTYANLILVAGYKIDPTDGKLHLTFRLFSRERLRVVADLETVANSMETTTPDADGYRYLPIATFWSLGRGKYGNDFRIRISHDKAADKENEFKNYNIDVLSTEDDAALLETFNVAFYIEAIDALTYQTIYAEEVVSDEDGNGSQKIAMQFFHDNFVTLFEQYKEAYENGATNTVTIEMVDRLPAITLPSTTDVYELTQVDGTFGIGNYVYDSVTGLFATSSFTIQDVNQMSDLTTYSMNVIYRAQNADATYAAGNWIYDGTNLIAGPDVITVTQLPSTTMYVAGTVYELTQNFGTYLAGSQWIYDAITNDFIAYVAPAPTVRDPLDLTIENWDMFGYNRLTKTADENMVIDGGTNSLTIFNLEGVALMNGDDGSLDETQPKAVRDAALEDAYLRALDGTTDKMILNKRRTPVEQMLDSNMSVNVKKAMASLTVQRGDMLLYLDCGLLNNIVDLRSMANALGTLDSWRISLNSGMMYTADPVTGKNIPVSILLWMAAAYPVHVSNYGWYSPFAGERYAIVSGYTDVKKIAPVYDEDMDAEILEELYDRYRINYLQALDQNTIVRGTQITCQSKWSDLSRENNVMVTLQIKRRVERLIAQNRYNWTEAAEIKTFKEDCEQVFSSYIGTRVKTLEVEVSQNAWERTRYILHAYLSVTFRKYQERGIVEIDLNPST